MLRNLLVVLLILLSISCTFSKEEEIKAEKANLPTLILENATYLLGQDKENPIVIKGDKITFYSDDNRALLENFSFEQRDESDKIILHGKANEGWLNTSSKTMDLKGDVSLIQLKERMEIETDNLYFDPDNQEISSSGSVVIKSESGDFKGSGFNGDLKMQNYSFDTLEEGWITE